MEDALSNLKFQYMNADGNITDNLNMKKLLRPLLIMPVVNINVNLN